MTDAALDAAAGLHGYFDRRSPLWFTMIERTEDMRFVGLRDGKLTRATVLIEAAPFSREASAARVGLVRELRRLGHRVCNSFEEVPFALKRAFVAMMEADHAR